MRNSVGVLRRHMVFESRRDFVDGYLLLSWMLLLSPLNRSEVRTRILHLLWQLQDLDNFSSAAKVKTPDECRGQEALN